MTVVSNYPIDENRGAFGPHRIVTDCESMCGSSGSRCAAPLYSQFKSTLAPMDCSLELLVLETDIDNLLGLSGARGDLS
jgi:hypothetical protein